MPSPVKVIRAVVFAVAVQAAGLGAALACAIPVTADADLDALAQALGVGTRSHILDRAAQDQACAMAQVGVVGVIAPDGSTPEVRLARHGYETCHTEQFQVIGPRHSARALEAWLPTLAPVLNEDMPIEPGRIELGLGLALAGDVPVWVLMLARPCGGDVILE